MFDDMFDIPNNPTIETKHKFYGVRRNKQWVEVTTENNGYDAPISIVYNFGDRREHLSIPREMAFALAQALTMVMPKLDRKKNG